jgi:hypothetical protein
MLIAIGVTGHREFLRECGLKGVARERLEHFIEGRIRRRVEAILRKFDLTLEHTPHRYKVISPLAEGGDQILADEILRSPRDGPARVWATELESVVPMSEDAYLGHFKTESGRQGFLELKQKAANPSPEPLVKSDAAQNEQQLSAYEEAGKQVASRCDVLIAAWDGEETVERAGTAATVKEATRLNKAVFHLVCPRRPRRWTRFLSHIESVVQLFENEAFRALTSSWFSVRWLRPFGIRFFDPDGDYLSSLHCLDAYNADLQERSSFRESPVQLEVPSSIGIAIRNSFSELSQRVNGASTKEFFAKSYGTSLQQLLLPMHCETALLADKYQRLYNFWIGTAPYVLVAMAVTTACAITSFWPERHAFYWLEVAETFTILVILAFANRAEWHRKRVDYRLLSERLRAALYLYIAGVQPERLALPPYLGSRHPDHWIANVFNLLTDHLVEQEGWPSAHFEPMKQFVLREWLEDQIKYYERRRKEHHVRQRGLEILALAVLVATLALTVLHASGLGVDNPRVSAWVIFLASALPALGAACGGILVHREFERTSYRYMQMVRALRKLLHQAQKSQTSSELELVLRQSDHLMLREQQGWKMTVGVEPPSPV